MEDLNLGKQDGPIVEMLLAVLGESHADIQARVDAGLALIAYCARWARANAKYEQLRTLVKEHLRDIALADLGDEHLAQQVRAAAAVLS